MRFKLKPEDEDSLLLDKAYILELWGKFEEALNIYEKLNLEVGIIRLLKKLGRNKEAKIYEDKLNEQRNRYPMFF